jgi:DNA-binding NarL/FixJ family response regulator
MNIRPTWVVLVTAGIFFIIDVIEDAAQGETYRQWGMEAIVFVAILLALAYEIYTTYSMERQLDSKESELQSLKGNLAEVVKDQFKKWALSNSESEVAWLIIKGFSFNEISVMRSVAEKTIRAQAGAVYRKSGTGNRSEFTATFLDDLLNHEH